MDPNMYHHSYLGFFYFLVIPDNISFCGYIQWTLKAVPDILYTIFFCFLAIFGKVFKKWINIQQAGNRPVNGMIDASSWGDMNPLTYPKRQDPH